MTAGNNPAGRVDTHVGRRLCIQRMSRSLTREQLAARLKLPSSIIVQRYENGIDRISASKLYEISKILDVPVAYFFEGYGQDQT